MKDEGLKMDRMTYGVVMFLHSRAGECEECIRLNEKMEEVGGWLGVVASKERKVCMFCLYVCLFCLGSVLVLFLCGSGGSGPDWFYFVCSLFWDECAKVEDAAVFFRPLVFVCHA